MSVHTFLHASMCKTLACRSNGVHFVCHATHGRQTMSNPVLFPPLAKCGSMVTRGLMERWHIRITDLSHRSGVSARAIKRFMYRKVSTTKFEEHGALYDALFEMCVEKAAWQAVEMKRLYSDFQVRRAALIAKERGNT